MTLSHRFRRFFHPGLEYFYLPRTMEQLAEFDSILESKFKTEVFDTYPVDNISEVSSNK